MKRTGVSDLPLHSGKAPRWLFSKMVRLSRAIVLAIVEEYGPEEFLRRISDPVWFQAFGCVLGFDWHSSGLTTTVCGALKEALRPLCRELGLFVCGGKGRASLKTPEEILKWAEECALPERLSSLPEFSRLAAKVDNAALQDGYTLYHHTFFFTSSGSWAVVQQGMNESTSYARRYHWLGERIKDLVEEPHSGIVSLRKEREVLDLTASKSRSTRDAIVKLLREDPLSVLKEVKTLRLPRRHDIRSEDLTPKGLERILLSTYERPPDDFKDVLSIRGLGPKTLRALTLVSELIYGCKASREDPVRYSYAHGGKDGHPYPVDSKVYEDTIAFLEDALRRARLGISDKLSLFKKLKTIF